MLTIVGVVVGKISGYSNPLWCVRLRSHNLSLYIKILGLISCKSVLFKHVLFVLIRGIHSGRLWLCPTWKFSPQFQTVLLESTVAGTNSLQQHPGKATISLGALQWYGEGMFWHVERITAGDIGWEKCRSRMCMDHSLCDFTQLLNCWEDGGKFHIGWFWACHTWIEAFRTSREVGWDGLALSQLRATLSSHVMLQNGYWNLFVISSCPVGGSHMLDKYFYV